MFSTKKNAATDAALEDAGNNRGFVADVYARICYTMAATPSPEVYQAKKGPNK